MGDCLGKQRACNETRTAKDATARKRLLSNTSSTATTTENAYTQGDPAGRIGKKRKGKKNRTGIYYVNPPGTKKKVDATFGRNAVESTEPRHSTYVNIEHKQEDTTSPPNSFGPQKPITSSVSKVTETEMWEYPLGRGIGYAQNSCYLDVTIFSMFYYLDIFDTRFLQGQFAEKTRNHHSRLVTENLQAVVTHMRAGFCPSKFTTKLRRSMKHLNRKLISDMMDIDELISILFGKALHLQPFIRYTIGKYSFHHQLIIDASKSHPKVGTVQDCLKESMKLQRLKFAGNPDPALFIKMPRSNGNLVRFHSILPNLTLDISEFVEQGTIGDSTFDLMAVIVLRNRQYNCFVRCGRETTSQWVYFNSFASDVKSVPNMGNDLHNFLLGTTNMTPDLKQIMKEIHVCIYHRRLPEQNEVSRSLNPKNIKDKSYEDRRISSSTIIVKPEQHGKQKEDSITEVIDSSHGKPVQSQGEKWVQFEVNDVEKPKLPSKRPGVPGNDRNKTAKKTKSYQSDLGRGIEYANNSCYIDSTLFSMFYFLHIFDTRFLNGEFSEETRNEVSRIATENLKDIVTHMRYGYCPSEYTAKLRSSLSHINSRLVSTMMDVDEFISNFFGKALHLQPFIRYTVGSKSFHHQLLINPSKPRPIIGTVEECLKESLQLQRLKFAKNPEPALFIKMPRSNGTLIGHRYILPNLTLDFAQFVDQEAEGGSIFDLMAVIVLRSMHYTTFVRCGRDVNSPWVYFNSLPANVKSEPYIGIHLYNFQKSIKNEKEDVPKSLQQIMGDIHVCIYEQRHVLETAV